MRGDSTQHRWFKGAASFAAFLALLLNVLVPQGFMASAQNGSGIVLCTGSGPVAIADLSPGGKPIKAPPAPKSDSHCAFAGHGGAAPLAVAAPLPVTAVIWRPIRLRKPSGAQVALTLAAPPPPAIGPPQAQA